MYFCLQIDNNHNAFRIRLLLLIACLQYPFNAISQNKYHHNVFWGRVVLADTINSKLKWEVWLQRRTQNTSTKDLNSFEAPQFSTIWLWLNYQVSNSFKISVTPFSYFKSWPLYAKSSDLEAQPVKEFRWVVRARSPNQTRVL